MMKATWRDNHARWKPWILSNTHINNFQQLENSPKAPHLKNEDNEHIYAILVTVHGQVHGRARSCTVWESQSLAFCRPKSALSLFRHGPARSCTGVHGLALAAVSCSGSCTGLFWLIFRGARAGARVGMGVHWRARAGARAGMGVHCWQNVDFCFRNAIFSCFLYWASARTCKFTNNSNKYLEQWICMNFGKNIGIIQCNKMYTLCYIKYPHTWTLLVLKQIKQLKSKVITRKQ